MKSNISEAAPAPVAVVGIGCRFPGANTPDQFWELLDQGRNAITEVPKDRFDLDRYFDPIPGTPGKVSSRFGGFLDDVAGFDAAFFGIAPSEARMMDPQQRLLLEVSWEAMEDAGLTLKMAREVRTAVFVAMQSSDYLSHLPLSSIDFDLSAVANTSRGAAAARISHAFGFCGPSMTIDADRSSALVAIHLATQSLQTNESDVAFVGASNLILSPEMSVALSRSGLLAPDGQCKFCDARADGIVRSEGVGVVVLKREEDAIAAGDLIYAVIRGSAVRHAAATGNDFLAPSVASQTALIKAAYARAEISASKVQYIEAHGAGNPKGDAIEIAALHNFLLGEERSHPCLVGSVKTNIGHAEAAGGMAAFIKTSLSLHYARIPATLHFANPHPAIDFDDRFLRVSTCTASWPNPEHKIAGVTSIGLTGTMAHVVLESPNHQTPLSTARSLLSPVIIPLSARSQQALKDLAGRYHQSLESSQHLSLGEIGYSAAMRREHHTCRTAFVATSLTELQGWVYSLRAEAEFPVGVSIRRENRSPIVFVFSGHGSQWRGMGCDLLRSSSTFRSAIEEYDTHLQRETGLSILEALTSPSTNLEDFSVTQPLLVGVMIALDRVLRSWNIQPDAVIGASVGEVAAAYSAGAISMRDAVRIVALRSKVLQELAGDGVLAVLQMSRADAEELIEEFGDQVAVACANGPRSTVLTGAAKALHQIVAGLKEKGIQCTIPDVRTAAHSRLIEPFQHEFRDRLRDITPVRGTISLWSTVTGSLIPHGELNADYWAANLRLPVLFEDGIRSLLKAGYQTFIEISPHPLLCESILDVAFEESISVTTAFCSQREKGDKAQLLEVAARLYEAGYDLDWSALNENGQPRFHRLPCYPWQHKTFWHSGESSTETAHDSNGRTPEPEGSMLASKLKRTTTNEKKIVLSDLLTNLVAKVVGIPHEDIDPRLSFRDMNVTSLMGTEIRVQLERALGTSLSSSLLFNYPSIESLAVHITDTTEGHAHLAELVTKAPLAEAQSQTDPEAIAIVGMACNFPGDIDDAESFWNFLIHGKDAIGDIPFDRWDVNEYYDPDPAAPGKSYSKWGGFLSSVYAFDPEFFGITSRQAEAMDPQQRLVLETAWHALEDSGVVPSELFGSEAGVFLGAITNNDYASLKSNAFPIYVADAHDSVGNAVASTAGRLSYFLGAHGPSMCIDTACSSSLVAVHLACQSLRLRECSIAIAGGVNVLLSPEPTVLYSKTRMLSPTGRCRTFDASADGYVRSEGCGIIVLKRLCDVSPSDRVLAVVAASAVNQDGRSNGLTAPNGVAQQKLLKQALDRSGLKSSDVALIEAHGTGTPLGDPIEVEAIGAVLGLERPINRPLLVGSVKANIGHLEGAAGIAGLIKAVLCLTHSSVPPQIHFDTVNPAIDLPRLGIRVPLSPEPWPSPVIRRVAGVSSFGFTGTNAHVLLCSKSTEGDNYEYGSFSRPAYLITASGRSPQAIQRVAVQYPKFLEAHVSTPLSDIAFTANAGREHHPHRIAVVASSSADAAERFREISQSLSESKSLKLALKNKRPKIAFLFAGQGSQYPYMGRQLYSIDPVFRKEMDRCSRFLEQWLNRSLVEDLYVSRGPEMIRDLTLSQVAMFCIEYSLAKTWESWGIRPDFVMGHSLGEYAAACISGLLSLEDALTFTYHRAEIFQNLTELGHAVIAFAGQERIRSIIDETSDDIVIAAVNSPSQVLLSGTEESIRNSVSKLKDHGVDTKHLDGMIGVHSRLMDPILDSVEELATKLDFGRLAIPFVSTVYGSRIDEATLSSPSYWRRHLRQPVEFMMAMGALHSEKCDFFLEIGPRHTLIRLGQACIPADEHLWLQSLSKEKQDWQQMLETLGELYTHGVDVDFSAFHRAHPGHVTSLPQYPFERQEFRPASPSSHRAEVVRDSKNDDTEKQSVFSAEWLACDPGNRKLLLEQNLKSMLNKLAAIPLDQIADDARFEELGVDSLIAMDLVMVLDKTLGVSVSETVVSDYPTLSALTDHLTGLLQEYLNVSPSASLQPQMPA